MKVKLLDDETKCTGCSACANICPQDCITMKPDEEGFLYPDINYDNCISCYKCKNICPIDKENTTYNYDSPVFFSAKSKNKVALLNSSSGGVFYLLAEYIIKQDGYVYGCIFDEEFKAIHIGVNNFENMSRMCGTKYVQSDVGNIYRDVKVRLDQNIPVLFTGTPCQIAGLNYFLSSKQYENLFLVEVLCHGVPSPVLFQKHIKYLEYKHKGRVTLYTMRSKKKFGWGCENRTYYEINKNGEVKGYHPLITEYFSAFFYGISLRPSCYICKYATPKRYADLTLGDFWGAWYKYKKSFPEGLSVVAVNNLKGLNLFKKVEENMDIDKVTFEEATRSNIHFRYPLSRMQQRESFYKNINKYGYKHIFLQVYFYYSNKKQILKTFYGRLFSNKLRMFIRRHILFKF